MQIFESKGDMGIFCNMKKQVTIPQEFNFAIDKRIPPPAAVLDLFDKVIEQHSLLVCTLGMLQVHVTNYCFLFSSLLSAFNNFRISPREASSP